MGDNIVDLRDLDEETLEEWRQAIEGYTGYRFDNVLENEPVMIADDYFTEYAEELAEDIGAISNRLQWPLSHIDWDAAAEELKSDYIRVTFDGDNYWFRAF